jgi:hypothetical protein
MRGTRSNRRQRFGSKRRNRNSYSRNKKGGLFSPTRRFKELKEAIRSRFSRKKSSNDNFTHKNTPRSNLNSNQLSTKERSIDLRETDPKLNDLPQGWRSDPNGKYLFSTLIERESD